MREQTQKPHVGPMSGDICVFSRRTWTPMPHRCKVREIANDLRSDARLELG